MYVTVRRDFVNVIGHIWQPGMGTCAMQYSLRHYDLENIGEFTRENVEHWLALNTGDFQSIDDFEATAGHDWIEWANPESELVFNDCMGD